MLPVKLVPLIEVAVIVVPDKDVATTESNKEPCRTVSAYPGLLVV